MIDWGGSESKFKRCPHCWSDNPARCRAMRRRDADEGNVSPRTKVVEEKEEVKEGPRVNPLWEHKCRCTFCSCDK